MRFHVGAVSAIVIFGALSPLAVNGQPGRKGPLTTVSGPWPAPVATNEPQAPPPLSPEDAMKTFSMPPGYHLQLVAAEPLVKDPILMEFDPDGRMWVLEMHGFSINDHMDNSFEPINDLVILEDTDHDGVYDKRTVFMDNLIMPRAFKILDKTCALVGEPPNLWKACDTDGDLKADTKELLNKTFSTQGVVEHGANGLFWGMDNNLYVAEHSWNARWSGGKLEILPSLSRGQWGVTQDNGGRIYRNVNTDPLFVDYVPPQYFVRNPNVVRTSGLYESLVNQADTLIWPTHPTKGVNRGYRPEIFRPDGSADYYQGVSSPLIYRGAALPKELANQAVVVDGPTNIVHLLNLKDDGSGRLSATDFYKKGEFLASTDIRFRPVALAPGWDGSFYIVDMYRGISQDGPIQTDYLRDYNAKRSLAKGMNYGRIYRVTHDDMPARAKPQMSHETSAQLVAHLSDPDGWWRDTAQQLIVQRGDKSIAPALAALAAKAPEATVRLQALWTLDGLGAVEPAMVLRALDDKSADARVGALRLSEHWLGQSKPMQAAVLRKIDDPNWLVRRQLAASLGFMPADARLAPAVAMLRKYGADKITVDATISSLPGQESAALAQLLGQPQSSADALTMLAGATGKRRDLASTQALITIASDPKQPMPTRVAVLNGLALGLQGGAGAGPSQQVEGGRAGAGIPGVAPTRRGPGPQRLELASEPTALSLMAGQSDPVGVAAKQVVALVNWPGKPPPPAAAPRTPEQEKLFTAGRQLYAVNCMGCHQSEGQGAEHVGAKLAGSKYVNANPDVPIRILLNGKEGPVGLMPPVGQGLSDDELASVLTYIRGSFGNTAAPIIPALVKENRLAYAHRTTPWTEPELAPPKR